MSKCEVSFNNIIYDVAWISFDDEQVCIKKDNQRIVLNPKELDFVQELFLSIPGV